MFCRRCEDWLWNPRVVQRGEVYMGEEGKVLEQWDRDPQKILPLLDHSYLPPLKAPQPMLNRVKWVQMPGAPFPASVVVIAFCPRFLMPRNK